MTPLDRILAHEDPERARAQSAYHKAERRYLGVSNEVLNELAKNWRGEMDLSTRVRVASDLWETDIHEARIAAAKLLTQARIREDGPVWELIVSWVPRFDGWAIADAVAAAGSRRLVADPSRLDAVETWTRSDHMWTRRAALVFTLPWSRGNHPSADDIARRERILGWAADYVSDRDWFIQKAVAWWLRALSTHDPERVRAFLAEHGTRMRAFARKEAGRLLGS